MTIIHRGDLFWTADDSRGYAHPHVIVQDDLFNHSRVATVIVCASARASIAEGPCNVARSRYLADAMWIYRFV